MNLDHPSRRRSGVLAAGIVAILAATVAALRFEGRRWWCACGEVFLWAGEPFSSHCSQHLFDPYALTHVLHGVGFCGIFVLLFPRLSIRWSFVLTVFAESCWEILENSQFVIDRYRAETAALGYEGDSIANSLGDVASCAAGWWLARRMGWKRSVVFFIAVEVVLLLWIRDNLLLNIVMLIWPVESLKNWQLGR